MKSIVLTGMSGAGKTTVGKLIAQKTGLEYTDTDLVIEKSEQKTINEIFKQYGETYFRELEHKIIKKISLTNSVISLGGGAFENSDTRKYLLDNTIVVYLETSAQQLLKRIENQNDRPLLVDNPSEKIKQLLNIREKNYKLANICVVTDNKTVEKITEEILKCVNLK